MEKEKTAFQVEETAHGKANSKGDDVLKNGEILGIIKEKCIEESYRIQVAEFDIG